MRKTWFLAVALTVTGLTAVDGYSSVSLREAIAEYQARTSTAFAYTLSVTSDRIVLAHGILSRPLSGDPVSAARRFLADNRDLFGLREGDVEYAEASTTLGPRTLRVGLQQTSGGIPVLGPQTYVHFDAAGRVVILQNNFLQDLTPPGKPAISTAVAAAKARQACGDLDGTIFSGEPALVIRPDGRARRLMYYIPVRASSTFRSYVVLVDALDCSVLPRRLPRTFEAVGTGKIYPENPVKTPLQVLQFTDMDNTTKLQGTYAKAYNANFVLGWPTSSKQFKKYTTSAEAARDYTYNPGTNGRFGEAMAYYHVTHVHNMLKALGFNELDRQMPTFVNVMFSQTVGWDNAWYSRVEGDPKLKNTGLLAFGAGDSLNNLSHDSDVIYHEYGHAALDRIQNDLMDEEEHNYGTAYHEGWGDMVAAWLNGNSKIGEYGLSEWADGSFHGREINNAAKYPKDVIDPELGRSEEHHTGLIPGGVFWDLRKKVGARAIQIFLNGNYALAGPENFFGIRDSVLIANDGADAANINWAFQKHGIKGADPGNKGSISNISVYTADYSENGWVKEDEFIGGAMVYVLADVTVNKSTPGYNIIPTLKLGHSEEFGEISVLPRREAVNGPHTLANQTAYVLGAIESQFDTPTASYALDVEVRLGGTNTTYKRTTAFKIW